MKYNKMKDLFKFYRQLEDYLDHINPITYKDEYENTINILDFIGTELAEDISIDNIYDYKFDMHTDRYDENWYEDDEDYYQFTRNYQYFDKLLRNKNNEPKKVVVKYIGYDYDEKTCTVTVNFSNNTRIIMNAVDFFMIESKISKMEYKAIIAQFAIEVLDDAS